jgi:hypothetical protein
LHLLFWVSVRITLFSYLILSVKKRYDDDHPLWLCLQTEDRGRDDYPLPQSLSGNATISVAVTKTPTVCYEKIPLVPGKKKLPSYKS